MVICAAVGCGSNSNISEELNISLYQLSREDALKFAWKQKLPRKKLPADENIRVCNLYFEEKCSERDLQVYTAFICPFIYPTILANFTWKV